MIEEIVKEEKQVRRSTIPLVTFGGPRYAQSYVNVNDYLRDVVIKTGNELGLDEPWAYVIKVDGKLSFVIGPKGLASTKSGIKAVPNKPMRASRLALVKSVKELFGVEEDRVTFTLDLDKAARVNYDGTTIVVIPMDDYKVANTKPRAKQLEIPFEEQGNSETTEAEAMNALEQQAEAAAKEMAAPGDEDNDVFIEF